MTPPAEDVVAVRSAARTRIDASAASHQLGPQVMPANLGSDVRTRHSPEKSAALRPTHFAAQRAFDLGLATIGLALFLIPGLAIVALVRCTSRGPVFYTQDRVGRDGELFRVYKFRTMLDGTHRAVLADDEARRAYQENDFKLPPDDPRITTIGRFLRRTSLDELPQLLNVLQGRMSIVGVRPLLVDEVALRPEHDQMLYRRMRPGMTGLWQVEGRSTIQKTDRLHLDRRYLENWSLWNDVKIAARTPFALLRIGRAQ